MNFMNMDRGCRIFFSKSTEKEKPSRVMGEGFLMPYLKAQALLALYPLAAKYRMNR
jgi:hypothetical protein